MLIFRAWLLTTCAALIWAGSPVQVQGHRGARASRPENTIPAFQFAIANGADVLELDLSVTKDNELVVSHDPILHGPMCRGPQASAVIRQLTLAQVREWDCGSQQNPEFPQQEVVPGTRMATLDEVFALASQGKFLFNIETKIFPRRATKQEAEMNLRRVGIDPASEQGRGHLATILAIGPEMTPEPDEFVQLVLAKIRKHHLESRVILQSFDFRTLRAMKRIAPEIRRSALTSDRSRSFVEIAKEAEATIISPVYPIVTAEKVEAAHAAGLTVVPWTANKPADWAKLVDAKVDAIITDDPAGLATYLKERR